MLIRCIVDSKNYSSKPQGVEVGGIINRMTIDTANEYSIDEIKQKILEGHTIRPSYCGGKEDTWTAQNMFMLDIDNQGDLTDDIVLDDYIKLVEGKKNKVKFLIGSKQHRTYNDVIKKCIDINIKPSFIYSSFNHSSTSSHTISSLTFFILTKLLNGTSSRSPIVFPALLNGTISATSPFMV
jgi:hypothetical protein